MSAAFEQAAGIAASKLSEGLRGVLFVLAMLWGAWVILGIKRHWQQDMDSQHCTPLELYARLLRMVIVVSILWVLSTLF